MGELKPSIGFRSRVFCLFDELSGPQIGCWTPWLIERVRFTDDQLRDHAQGVDPIEA